MTVVRDRSRFTVLRDAMIDVYEMQNLYSIHLVDHTSLDSMRFRTCHLMTDILEHCTDSVLTGLLSQEQVLYLA